jgi:hypothetical protein
MLLKLLGVGKFLRSFFLQNWKWLTPLLLVIVGFFWTKNHYLDQGRTIERAVWESRVEAEKVKNQLLTNALADSVLVFSKALDSRNDARIQTETVRETRISTIVEEKPIYQECKVDQEIINEQNALKALGPRP